MSPCVSSCYYICHFFFVLNFEDFLYLLWIFFFVSFIIIRFFNVIFNFLSVTTIRVTCQIFELDRPRCELSDNKNKIRLMFKFFFKCWNELPLYDWPVFFKISINIREIELNIQNGLQGVPAFVVI